MDPGNICCIGCVDCVAVVSVWRGVLGRWLWPWLSLSRREPARIGEMRAPVEEAVLDDATEVWAEGTAGSIVVRCYVAREDSVGEMYVSRRCLCRLRLERERLRSGCQIVLRAARDSPMPVGVTCRVQLS
eukprot:6471386-Prymnesium_polylepis.1